MVDIKSKLTAKNITFLVMIAVILASLIISLCLNPVKSNKKRRTFIFPSAENNALIVDTRYLESVAGKSDVEVFISDLLLGSAVERTKPIFAKGTKVNSCFVRGKTVYLDLSEELISAGDEVISIKEGIEILEKNLYHNFSDIDSVEIFINGKYAFENSKNL